MQRNVKGYFYKIYHNAFILKEFEILYLAIMFCRISKNEENANYQAYFLF